MNRSKIENILLKMGMPASLNGFRYITDAIMIIDECGSISITKHLYPEISKKNGGTVSRIERAIRHAFGVVRERNLNPELIDYYIGLNSKPNSESLTMLHLRIKLECEKENEWVEEIHNFKFGWNGYRFLVIYGKGPDGWFVSIPSHNTCIEIAEPQNVGYNSERLDLGNTNIEGIGIVLAKAIKKNWEES